MKGYFPKLLVLFLMILVAFAMDLWLGSVSIPFEEVVKTLLGSLPDNETWQVILLDFRLPKALTAVLAGAALGISGLQMQTLFRNPVAGPYILGISAGATLGVALMIMAFQNQAFQFFNPQAIFGSWMLIVAAFLGALGVLLLVLLLSQRVGDIMTLLILGLMLGSVTSAFVSILQYFSPPDMVKSFVIWTFGSLGGVSWTQLRVLGVIVGCGMLITTFLVKPLNILLLGENYARSSGLDVFKTRLWIIISTSLLAGGITAFCGPIAFIGLAVPHLCRMAFGTTDHKILVPLVVLMGIFICLVCDIISQIPGSDNQLPINAVTSLMGAPVVIWIVVSQRKQMKGFF